MNQYIYIDESGDFGQSPKSTKSVIIAATLTSSPREISIWLKRIRRRKLPKRLRKVVELKAAHLPEQFLKYFYQHAVTDLKITIFAMVINKKSIPKKLKGEEGLIYLSAIKQLISLTNLEKATNMFWYFDRRPLKKLSWEIFRQTIRGQLLLSSKSAKLFIEIHAVDSQRLPAIQLADFIAFAIGRLVNHHDHRWYNLIKSSVKEIKTINFKY